MSLGERDCCVVSGVKPGSKRDVHIVRSEKEIVETEPALEAPASSLVSLESPSVQMVAPRGFLWVPPFAGSAHPIPSQALLTTVQGFLTVIGPTFHSKLETGAKRGLLRYATPATCGAHKKSLACIYLCLLHGLLGAMAR